MRNLDKCYTYELNTTLKETQSFLRFYKMTPDGSKIDGTTNEEVIKVLIHRITCLNSDKFKCRENSVAITKLEEALMWLEKRTANRILRNVEGTQNV